MAVVSRQDVLPSLFASSAMVGSYFEFKPLIQDSTRLLSNPNPGDIKSVGLVCRHLSER